MIDVLQPPQRIAIAAHPEMPEATELAEAIAQHLKAAGIYEVHGKINAPSFKETVENGGFDMLLALGGDGTMLRAGHLCAPINLPILGINLGRFGFLTEVRRESWKDIMPRLLKGDYWLEGRMMLRAEHLRKGKKLGDWEIVNEAVIGRGTTVRPVRLTAHVNNCFLTTYVADGLIVSTATGSTAYALAVGGPILPPSLRNILIIPIAPHLSFDRGVVLHEGSHVVVTIETDHQAALSVDGQSPIKLLDRDQVEVFSNEHSLQFVRFQDPGYFYRNLMLYMNKNPFAKARR